MSMRWKSGSGFGLAGLGSRCGCTYRDHLQPEDLYLPYSLDPSSAAQQAKQIDSQVRGLVPKFVSLGPITT